MIFTFLYFLLLRVHLGDKALSFETKYIRVVRFKKIHFHHFSHTQVKYISHYVHIISNVITIRKRMQL